MLRIYLSGGAYTTWTKNSTPNFFNNHHDEAEISVI